MASKRIIEAIDFEDDNKNWKYPFKVMTKKYGKDFIEVVKASWEANDDVQTAEEFCTMNDIPEGFFNNVIIGNKKTR